MALVNDDVTVRAQELANIGSPRERLDHRDVDAMGDPSAASTDPSDRLGWNVKELGEAFYPLLDERSAVHQDQRRAAAAGEQTGRQDGLAPARRGT